MRALLLFISLLLPIQSSFAGEMLSFGVVPQQSASTLARLWTPVLQYLSEHSGLEIQFKTAPNIPTFEKRLAAGDYDFAYMNPYHYVVFHEAPGYRAMAKARDKRIKGIIVARQDRDITRLTELDNSALAFPAPAAFAASILPRSELTARGIEFEPNYVSSHDSVYLAVSKGLYPAGGGVIRTFRNTAPEVRERLRILWTTRGYTPHAIAAHPSVETEQFEKFQQALASMEQSDAGQTLLETLKIKGFEPAIDRDWNDIRDLNINLLSSTEEAESH